MITAAPKSKNGYWTATRKIDGMKNMNRLLFALVLSLGTTVCGQPTYGQASLPTSHPALAVKYGNLQVNEVASKGKFLFSISHRFGAIRGGVNELFGLDQAVPHFLLVYAPIENLQLSLGRGSLRKTFTGAAKYRFLKQGENMPFSLTAFSTINLNTELRTADYFGMKFFDRLSYNTQLIFGKRLGERWNLQLAPSFVRQNLVMEYQQDHDQFALAVGGQFAVSKVLAVFVDCAIHFNRHPSSTFRDPLTTGLSIHTRDHEFQLMFSNARSMSDVGHISNAEGNWEKGEIFFGFTIVRSFR